MRYLLAIILVVGLVIPGQLFACEKNVYYLVKDEKAPCTGYLFSPKKQEELQIMDREYKLLQKELPLYHRQIELLNKTVEYSERIADKEREKAELWRKTAEDITLKYVEVEEGRWKRDMFFLGSGILLTVLAGWMVGQASK